MIRGHPRGGAAISERVEVQAVVKRAQSYTQQLRERVKALADSPQREGWWDLTKLVNGVDRWRTRLRERMGHLEHSDALTGAYLQLTQACDEARTTIKDLSPLFADQAAVRRSPRRQAERPAGPGSFRAKFESTCQLCGQAIRPGDVARFGLGGSTSIRHDACPRSDAT